MRRHILEQADQVFNSGATFYSLDHAAPSRIDFYRARVVDGLGKAVHERLFAVEQTSAGKTSLCEPGILGNFTPASAPAELPDLVHTPELSAWLHEKALQPFLDETRAERIAEVDRIASHIELSLTELIQKVDQEIGKIYGEKEKGILGAEGRLAQAESRHAELMARRDRRRTELARQRSLTLQGVERIASVLVLPHPCLLYTSRCV